MTASNCVRNKEEHECVSGQTQLGPGCIRSPGLKIDRSTPFRITFQPAAPGARIDAWARSISHCDGVVMYSRESS